MSQQLTDEQIAEEIASAKRMVAAGMPLLVERVVLALHEKFEEAYHEALGGQALVDVLREKLQAAEAQLKPIADWLGSPKDNHRLGEVIPGILSSYRQRCEAAEADLTFERTARADVEQALLAALVRMVGPNPGSDDRDAAFEAIAKATTKEGR